MTTHKNREVGEDICLQIQRKQISNPLRTESFKASQQTAG